MDVHSSPNADAAAAPAWERIDTGPLSWVMPELREALDRSLESVRTFAKSREDATPLKLAKSHLHQAHGALQIVDVEGVSLVTEEVEALLETFEADPYACTPEAVDAIGLAYRAVTEYLEEVLAGAPHQPVRLFPSYRALLFLRGADRIHPADLFYPDLSIRPPRTTTGAQRVLSAAEIAVQRSRFERALLQYLRDDSNRAAAEEMRAAVTLIEASPKQGQQRAFWWVTRAFFDATAAGAIPADLNVKRLCARINLQIRRLLEGSGMVAERLLRDTLFFVARAKPATPHIAEVKQVYLLDHSLPEDFETERYGRINFVALRSAKEALGSAKAAWSMVVGGELGQISSFARDASALLAATGSLGRPGLAHVAQVVASIGTELSFDPRKPTDAVGLDVATALLFLEGALDQVRSLDETFDERAQAVVARVESSAVGNPVDEGQMPWLDEISRRAQERLTMASFVGEMQSNLRSIEKSLDAFFRDPTQRAELPQAEKLLSQIGGALSVLGHEQAGQAIENGRTAIMRFADPSYEPDLREFERIAESLGAVGFYIENLQHRSDVGTVFRFDQQTGTFTANLAQGPAEKAMAEEEPEPDPEPPGPGGLPPPSVPDDVQIETSVEEEIGRDGDAVARLAETLRQDPSDAAARYELGQALHRVQQDALLVDDSSLKERAAHALKILRDSSPDEGADLTASVFNLTSQTNRFTEAWDMTRTAPLPAVSAPVPSSDTPVDAELLGIFLGEAIEVLEAARSALIQMSARPDDRELLTAIRRSFHTLKGSGRMVGLNVFGEAAWGVEQTLNHWLAEAWSASPELIQLLKRAVDELDAWVVDLTDTGHSARTSDALYAAAATVRDSRTHNEPFLQFTPPAAAPPVPVTVPAVAPPVSVAAPAAVPPLQREADWTATEVIQVVRVPLEGAAEDYLETEVFPRAVGDDEFMNTEVLAPHETEPDTLELSEPPLVSAGTNADTGTELQDSTNEAMHEHVDYSFEVEPVAAPAPPKARVLAFAPPSGARSDEFKQIGTLTLSVPLYNIYLSEADELLRALIQDFGEWRHELDREVSDSAVRAAHSLSGSSATVGLTAVHELAYALEAVLQALKKMPSALELAQAALLEEGVEVLRGMLHRFAAGALPERNERMESRLIILRDEFKNRHAGIAGRSEHPELAFDDDTRKEHSNDTHVRLAPSDGSVPPLQSQSEAKLEIIAERDVHAESGDEAEIEAEIETVIEAEIEAEIEIEIAARAEIQTPLPALSADAPAPAVSIHVADAATLPVSAVAAPRILSNVRDEIDLELIAIFLQEAGEYLPQIGENLRLWQREPSNLALSQALLRQMHTVKGSARMAGAMRLGEVIHDMETRVEFAAHMSEIPMASFEELLAEHDRSLELYDGLMHPAVQSESDVAQDAAQSVAVGEVKTELQEERPESGEVASEGQSFDVTPGTTQTLAGRGAGVVGNQIVQAVRVRADVLDRLVNQAGEVSISRSRLENEVGQIKTSLSDLTENLLRLRGQLREIEIQAESQMQSQFSLVKERERFDPLEFDRFTRLQELTRMMAESVNDVATVHQNLLKSLESANRDLDAQQRMTRDLQQDLMRVRMIPFSSVAERLYRVVRQTAKELDKRVNLDIRGGGVEIDRGVLERMIAPFEHLLRNAIVHGIETRAERALTGKSETGELLIEVRQEGNEIVIIFTDDGAGLNLSRIREKGRQVGLIDGEAELPDARAADLIFQPGFSTAAEITELAGRGIGMDVVRAEAGGLGGRVSVDSAAGNGTRFTINLPLTLAVTQVVLVSVGGRTYALPSVLVEQVQQLRPQPLAQAYNDGQILWLGQPVRLHFLAGLLGERHRSPVAQRYSPVVILRSGGERIAVHVDEVLGNQEVVVKNVGPQLARMSGIAGATVLGSGDIVLILNPVQLARQSERERLHSTVAANAEIGGAIAELIDEPTSFGRAEPVAGLETLPIVMVVDDSLTVRRVTQRLLTREGYQVVLAKDGVDALQQLQDYTPDVMLVDIEMPRMDGYDLTRNIRSDERYHNIPIIMITSRTADKHKGFALELGVNVYLGKPYQESELLAHLAQFVGNNRRAQA